MAGAIGGIGGYSYNDYGNSSRYQDGMNGIYRADVVPDVRIIGPEGCRFGVAHIFPLPDIQPLAQSKPGRDGVCPVVDGHGCGLQLLPDFFLRLAGKRPLNLLPCSRVPPGCDPGLPIGVFLPAPLYRLFADVAAAFRSLLCHKKFTCPFKNGCNEPGTGGIIALAMVLLSGLSRYGPHAAQRLPPLGSFILLPL